MLPILRSQLRCIFRLTPVAWDLLITPVEHPQFQLTRHQSARIRIDQIAGVLLAVITLFAGIYAFEVWYFQPRANVAYLLLTGLVACSSLYVGLWVLQISEAISAARRNRTYDLICVLPTGPQGADLAFSAACLHRFDALGWIDWLRKAASTVLLIVFMFVLLSATLSMREIDVLHLLGVTVDVILLVVISYAEHMQSTVCGTLVGVLVSRLSESGSLSTMWAVGSFLAIQILSLSLALLLAGWTSSDPSSYRYPIGATTTGLFLFYVLRQCTAAILWKQARYTWGQ